MRLVPLPFVIPGGRPSVAATARVHENIRPRPAGGSAKSAILREVGCCAASALIFAPWGRGRNAPAANSFHLQTGVYTCGGRLSAVAVRGGDLRSDLYHRVFEGAIESSDGGRKTITRTVIGGGARALLGGIFGGKGAGIGSFIGGSGGLGTTASHGRQKSRLTVARKC